MLFLLLRRRKVSGPAHIGVSLSLLTQSPARKAHSCFSAFWTVSLTRLQHSSCIIISVPGPASLGLLTNCGEHFPRGKATGAAPESSWPDSSSLPSAADALPLSPLTSFLYFSSAFTSTFPFNTFILPSATPARMPIPEALSVQFTSTPLAPSTRPGPRGPTIFAEEVIEGMNTSTMCSL